MRGRGQEHSAQQKRPGTAPVLEDHDEALPAVDRNDATHQPYCGTPATAILQLRMETALKLEAARRMQLALPPRLRQERPHLTGNEVLFLAAVLPGADAT